MTTHLRQLLYLVEGIFLKEKFACVPQWIWKLSRRQH